MSRVSLQDPEDTTLVAEQTSKHRRHPVQVQAKQVARGRDEHSLYETIQTGGVTARLC